MEPITITFHGAANDFLPLQRRNTTFSHYLKEPASIKDVIEALGVPHTEAEGLLANGRPVDFSYLVRAGDRLDIYDFTAVPEIAAACPLRPPLMLPIRFILDVHLGQLATSLRLLGFDSLYDTRYHDAELAELSSEQSRVLLTRDRGLLKRRLVT